MNDNRKVIYLKDYKEQKNKIEPRDFIYIPIAYCDACFDIVKRHNPKASQKELQSEYNRCMNLAKKHHYPDKALLSLFCYSYFCPTDLNNETKPVNILENTIDMTEFFKSLPAMEDKELKNIYQNCINDIAENKPNKEEAEFRSKVIEREWKRRLILYAKNEYKRNTRHKNVKHTYEEKNNLKGSDVFIAIVGIGCICSALSSLIGNL